MNECLSWDTADTAVQRPARQATAVAQPAGVPLLQDSAHPDYRHVLLDVSNPAVVTGDM